MKFKEWKTGWKEQHLRSGDEFDDEILLREMNHFLQILKNQLKQKL